MSIYALPVSVQDLLDLQESIQFFTNEAQATSQAAAINGGTSTVYDYALQLLNANLATSQVAMAVPSLILNETPAVDVLANVSLNFLPAQIDFAISQGLDPVVYAAETWAVNTANDNAAAFDALYGALSATQFATVVSTTTGVNTTAILQFINNWEDFYTHNPNAIPANLDVQSASYAAAFGDAIGNALVDDSPFTQSVNDLTENALLTIATGQYVVGVPITALPDHTPLQGEQDLRLTIGVDDLQTSTPGAIFDASPEANPPLGTANTLNTGDTLVDTAGDGTLDYTAVSDIFGINDPFAVGVNMTGIFTANILNISDEEAGFAGNINGLAELNVLAGSLDDVQVGLDGLGLNDPLQALSISASVDVEVFTESAAFGAADELQVTLNGVDTFVDIDTSNGASGYAAINVSSLGGPNFIDLDTDVATVATVSVDGDQDIVFNDASNVLDRDTLELFDGTAATGNITAFFDAPGDVEVQGGSGDDDFSFSADPGAISVFGNGGNDVFTFFSDDDPATFGADDSADGGAGENRLRIEADSGALLAAGVGPNIVNIQTIEHFGETDGTVTVDMARSGSANVLDLAADYDNNDVTVTNLVNTKTVIFTGDDIDDLSLNHNVVGQINLTLAQTAAGGTQSIEDLHVNNGTTLNLLSTGNATVNDVDGVGDVNASVSITGDTDLRLGDDDAYDFANGVIDAAAFTANLFVAVGANSQTVIGGLGDDIIDVRDSSNGSPDIIRLEVGGSDDVIFRNAFGDANQSTNPNTNYHTVNGFDIANDQIVIDDDMAGGLNQTDGGGVSNPAFVFTYTGTSVNLSAQVFDFIKIDQPVAVAGGTAQTEWNAAMGGNTITVFAAGNFLMSYYDTFSSEMVLVVAHSGNTVIAATDDIDVVAQIPMSVADYHAFSITNNTLVFTA